MTTLAIDPGTVNEDHLPYLTVIPRVAGLARRRFAYLSPEQREDAVAEAIAAGFLAYISMKRRGRLRLIDTLGFAHNAVRHVVGGRRVGSSQASGDVMSDLGRRRHRRELLSYNTETHAPIQRENWVEEAMADRQTPIPEQVAIRIDGGRWLTSLNRRDRRMVKALAAGDKATDVAKRSRISQARLSQLRKQWATSWQRRVGSNNG